MLPSWPKCADENASAGTRVGDSDGDCAVGLLVVVDAVEADWDELSLRPNGRSNVYKTKTAYYVLQ